MGVAYSRNKLALRSRILNLSLMSQISIFEVGVEVGAANLFLVKSIGID